MAPAQPLLTLFALDHTLLCGDGDVLWCDFLMQHAGAGCIRQQRLQDLINALPLLQAVDVPVAVDPDPRLAAGAQARGWQVLALR